MAERAPASASRCSSSSTLLRPATRASAGLRASAAAPLSGPGPFQGGRGRAVGLLPVLCCGRVRAPAAPPDPFACAAVVVSGVAAGARQYARELRQISRHGINASILSCYQLRGAVLCGSALAEYVAWKHRRKGVPDNMSWLIVAWSICCIHLWLDVLQGRVLHAWLVQRMRSSASAARASAGIMLMACTCGCERTGCERSDGVHSLEATAGKPGVAGARAAASRRRGLHRQPPVGCCRHCWRWGRRALTSAPAKMGRKRQCSAKLSWLVSGALFITRARAVAVHNLYSCNGKFLSYESCVAPCEFQPSFCGAG